MLARRAGIRSGHVARDGLAGRRSRSVCDRCAHGATSRRPRPDRGPRPHRRRRPAPGGGGRRRRRADRRGRVGARCRGLDRAANAGRRPRRPAAVAGVPGRPRPRDLGRHGDQRVRPPRTSRPRRRDRGRPGLRRGSPRQGMDRRQRLVHAGLPERHAAPRGPRRDRSRPAGLPAEPRRPLDVGQQPGPGARRNRRLDAGSG